MTVAAMTMAVMGMTTKSAVQTTAVIASPLGNLALAARADGLVSLSFTHAPLEPLPAHRILSTAVEELERYFQGTLTAFTVPLAPSGTPFQKEVWTALQRVPYGTICSYKELAFAAGHPTAHRAVGTAVGRNPLAILIPCHRVIRSDGSMGNYTGGVHLKASLLEIEGIRLHGEKKE